MKLRKLTIRNFRGIRDITLDLDDLTVLIGENNSGKTAVLDALRICLRELGPRRRVVFDAFDFHMKDADADPATAEPIQITVTFSEDDPGDWGDKLTGRLNRQKILQVGDDERAHVILRVTCAYDVTRKEIDQSWSFLTLGEQPLAGASEWALGTLQAEVAYFYLAALRDAARHFDAKGPYWRPFLKDSQLSDAQKSDIEEKLKEVNDLIVASHTSFDVARKRLERLQDVVPIADGDVVAIEAVPGRVFDMLAKAQIHIGTATGAKIPVGRHGEGAQSLAVLMLFSAFLDTRDGGTNVVALEEPEAHLHPSAIRALWSAVEGISGQKVISTHSGDLLSEIEIPHIRRLARTAEGIGVYMVPSDLLSQEEIRKLTHHVRRTRGELLFARCWLLVEGETESWIYPAAARACAIDLHRIGVRVVEYSQSDVGLLAKVANALGIPWYCVVDDDSGRAKYEDAVRSQLNTSIESDRMVLPYPNMEVHLLHNGYDAIYDQFVPLQKRPLLTLPATDPGYWAQFAALLPNKAKTRGAAAVATEMESRGASGVTAEIRSVLDKAVALAGGS